MRFTNGVLHWEIHFCRNVHNRELEAFWSFINTIYCTPARGFGEDKRCWLPCKSKGFTVSAYYHLLVGHSEQFFPWKSIWKQKIPSRVAFFVWTVALGKCLTIENLRKKKVCILDWCYMCKCNCESVDHLFLHCPVALELWDMVFGLFGVYWVMPMFVIGLLACWQGWFGHHRNGDIWMVVPHCLLWCIWKERNSRCFDDIERSMPNIKLLFFRTLLDWFSVWRNHPFSSILDLLDFCNVCSWFVHPCIPHVYLGVSLFLSMNFFLLIKKKKKKRMGW